MLDILISTALFQHSTPKQELIAQTFKGKYGLINTVTSVRSNRGNKIVDYNQYSDYTGNTTKNTIAVDCGNYTYLMIVQSGRRVTGRASEMLISTDKNKPFRKMLRYACGL